MEMRNDKILKKNIDKLIGEALKNHVFSACSIGFLVAYKNNTKRDVLSYGVAGEIQASSPVDEQTFFDLASLTKPLVTALCLLVLLDEGKLHLEDRLDKFFKTTPPAKSKITLYNLVTHSSGLPAHRPYYQDLVDLSLNERMDRVIEWILGENIYFQPGTGNLYSDLGFILLGKIIEKVSGESLNGYWTRKILEPLDLEKGLFFAGKQKKGSEVYAATGVCSWSKKRLYGVVHDDNCRALGGVAGHAGLFGTAHAVLSLAENIILQFWGDRQHPAYRSETLRKVLGNKKGPWAFGFDTPTPGLSSSGKYFSDMSFGHLGFTGTSFWVDLHRRSAIVFLTNRVFCGDAGDGIKKIRPLLHDAIMEAIIKKSG